MKLLLGPSQANPTKRDVSPKADREGPDTAATEPPERQVAEPLAKNATNQQITDTLLLSPRTVEQHVANALRRLNTTAKTSQQSSPKTPRTRDHRLTTGQPTIPASPGPVTLTQARSGPRRLAPTRAHRDHNNKKAAPAFRRKRPPTCENAGRDDRI
ncbi:LuxR C-terminal-related transcriptional regulator [Kitasatospora viridis]|uniref:LuxR C-terminal-related transcriptional regulator n=1 Tax=Kitasatospora viridis TaxID=281105 RepID=UPI00119FDE16